MPHYHVSVRTIADVVGGEIAVSDAVTLEPLVIGDEEFVFTAPAAFSAVLTNTSAGIVAIGTVSATVETECSRCLERFEMPLTGEIEGFYVTEARKGSIPKEQPYEVISDHTVDLIPAIMQALTVEAPFAPIHAEDCRGICPTCGTDRNVEECACEPEPVHSPFQALRGIFGEVSPEDPSS